MPRAIKSRKEFIVNEPDLESAQHAEHSRKRNQAENALKRADKASRRGDAAEAKRWADIARAMADASRVLAETPPPPSPVEGEESRRADLRARIAKLVEAEQGVERWEMRHEIWLEMAADAEAEGRPPPPPMPPRPGTWGDDISGEDAVEDQPA
jgi:hypothetical protein